MGSGCLDGMRMPMDLMTVMPMPVLDNDDGMMHGALNVTNGIDLTTMTDVRTTVTKQRLGQGGTETGRRGGGRMPHGAPTVDAGNGAECKDL